MSSWWAEATATASGLPPVENDVKLERGRASAHPRRARPGDDVDLRLAGYDPGYGPVDLTIYGPTANGADAYEVVVEATLHDRGRGTARFTFLSDRGDRPGRYRAVFRQTDYSSAPVGDCAFELS